MAWQKKLGQKRLFAFSFAQKGIVFKDTPRWLCVRFIPAFPLPVISTPFSSSSLSWPNRWKRLISTSGQCRRQPQTCHKPEIITYVVFLQGRSAYQTPE